MLYPPLRRHDRSSNEHWIELLWTSSISGRTGIFRYCPNCILIADLWNASQQDLRFFVDSKRVAHLRNSLTIGHVASQELGEARDEIGSLVLLDNLHDGHVWERGSDRESIAISALEGPDENGNRC